MYLFLLHLHSILRWILIVFLLYTVVVSVLALIAGKPYTKGWLKTLSFSIGIAHIQFVAGIFLYFLSPILKAFREIGFAGSMKNTVARFWTLEHSVLMLLAIFIITYAKYWQKSCNESKRKYYRVIMCFSIALVLIFIAIPWPFMKVGAGRNWINP